MAKLGLTSTTTGAAASASPSSNNAGGAEGEGEEGDGLDADAVKELATEEALQRVCGILEVLGVCLGRCVCAWGFVCVYACVGLGFCPRVQCLGSDFVIYPPFPHIPQLDKRQARQAEKEAAKADRETKRKQQNQQQNGEPLQSPQDTDHDPKAREFFTELGEELRVRPAVPGQAVLFSQVCGSGVGRGWNGWVWYCCFLGGGVCVGGGAWVVCVCVVFR